MSDKLATDKKALRRIHAAINNPDSYSKLVDGVHTWDVAKIFKDFRATIHIANRAIKAAASK